MRVHPYARQHHVHAHAQHYQQQQLQQQQQQQHQLRLQQQQMQQQRHHQQAAYSSTGGGLSVGGHGIGGGGGGGSGGSGGRSQLPILASVAPSSYPQQQLQQHHPNLSTGHLAPAPTAPAPLAPQRQRTNPLNTTLSMSTNSQAMDDHELAHMQRLSNDYVPEDTGPLVGDRQSTTELTAEYANGDPVYRTKTAALPRKYAFYRTCRGDGHCGWRAIAFSYFETLVRVGDVGKFDIEQVRLKSMQNLLNAAGHSDDIVGDFAEETFGLMHELAMLMSAPDGNPSDHLLCNFNDYSRSMAIVTHFKLLASAWIQSHPDDYLPFLLDYADLKSYCEENFERAVCEIDHVGVAALGEAVVKPAGFALEVLYLDRSPGEEINHTYRAEPLDHEGFPIANPPTLRVLYRPGHYDILYKADDFPAIIPSQAPIQVALAPHTGRYDPAAIAAPIHDYTDLLLSIPGAKMWESPPAYDFNLNPTPPSQVAPVSSYAPVPTPAPPVAEQIHDYAPPTHMGHVNNMNNRPAPRHHSIKLEQPVTLPVHPPPPMSLERGLPMAIERTEPFRPSAYTLEPGFRTNQMHALPFQTSQFRNSPYNTAHFLNPDFQPEEWSPEAEYSTGNRGRLKSSSQ